MSYEVIVIRSGEYFIGFNAHDYPVLVDSPWEAKHWETIAQADAWRRLFPSRFHALRIQKYTAIEGRIEKGR